MRILFPCLDTRATTGARYAEQLMRRALLTSHTCRILDGSAAPWRGSPLFGLIPVALRPFYDLVVSSDNYVVADLLYVQPHAGGLVAFPWLDTMTFRAESRLASLQLRLLLPMARHTYATAMLLANSKFTRVIMKEAIGVDSPVLYPPVPTHLYSYETTNRSNEVITISALNDKKNLPYIARVAASMTEGAFGLIGYAVKEHMDVLDAVRGGFERDAPRARFTYYASLGDPEKAAILGRTKAYLHPTVAEPFGIAIVEAMAAGCIPIVHNSGGVREFVPSEWRYTTPAEAAMLIGRALTVWSPTIALQMREAALAFSESVFVGRFLTYVDEACNRRRGGKGQS